MENLALIQEYSTKMRQTVFLDDMDQAKIQEIRSHLFIHKPIKINARRFIQKVFEDTDFFVCIFNKTKKGGFNELFGVRKEINTVIKRYEGKEDTYISYSSYVSRKENEDGKVRTIDNIRHTVCLVQDLDYYKWDISEGQALEIIHDLVESQELEMPHIIIFTGKGIQLVWLTDNVYMKRGSKSHKVWSAIQNYQFNVLKDLNPDTVVKSPSAVTRLPNSINSKNGEEVRAFLLRDDRLPLGYFLEHYDLFPKPDRKVQPRKRPRAKVVRNPKMWNDYTLNMERQEDIFRIVRYKQSKGESLIGIRQHLALVLRFHALVTNDGDFNKAEERVCELWDCIEQQEDTSLEEILRRSAAAERYYLEWIGKAKWQGEGTYKQPGLFYKNRTLIEFWDLSRECQIHLKTIKVRDKEYERLRQEIYRRKNGDVDRASYLTSERQKTEDKVLLLQEALKVNPKANRQELADRLEVSVFRIDQLKKELKKLKSL